MLPTVDGAGGDHDALARLAASVERPPASLSALGGLTSAQLGLLTDAIEATYVRHQGELDAEFARALPVLPRKLLRR